MLCKPPTEMYNLMVFFEVYSRVVQSWPESILDHFLTPKLALYTLANTSHAFLPSQPQAAANLLLPWKGHKNGVFAAFVSVHPECSFVKLTGVGTATTSVFLLRFIRFSWIMVLHLQYDLRILLRALVHFIYFYVLPIKWILLGRSSSGLSELLFPIPIFIRSFFKWAFLCIGSSLKWQFDCHYTLLYFYI